jgi:DNA-directed RNA polymerase specialized sigma54-like protein
MSGISQSVDGKQVPAVQVIELPLQRLQSEIEILKVNTKDLPQEINDLRNKVLDIEAQLAPAAFSKAFSSTIHDLTTKSKAAIHTKVGKVLESQELRDRVSSQVVEQMETEKTQRVLQEEIFERLHYMVDEVFVGVKKRIDKIEKELTAKMEVLSKEAASRQE